MRTPVRVGIIGANPERGWAAAAHVPALHALPDYALTAVGTRRPDSAREAARRFGAEHAFTDPHALAAHPDVDLVVVTVKVPHHAELIDAALDAGKHVLAEWPLALTTAEAENLTEKARAAGVRTAIGLQARHSPAVRHARGLITDGYLGEITSATLYAAIARGAGGTIPAEAAYTFDRANGAGLLEVTGGHSLDVLNFLAGDLTALSAILGPPGPNLTIAETDELVRPTSPAQVLVSATLTNNAVASIHLANGKASNSRTRLEFSGTEGDLAVVTDAHDLRAAQIQIGEPRLLGARLGESDWQELRTPAPSAEQSAQNVRLLYEAFAHDLHTGGQTVADFAHAVKLHRLLDTIREAAADGTRHTVTGYDRAA
ncbi:Gfo/Idh/MocA family protein [Actinomadura hibisca]|uniref:Gfo/Idh/MocA family protein n=1 Tax=Actinomadura hibisca TaxID=68565 RepID=UPI00082D0C7A|nr:Gfo/Idh/MocA family oxidoreductase [Actinomadura hibisca]